MAGRHHDRRRQCRHRSSGTGQVTAVQVTGRAGDVCIFTSVATDVIADVIAEVNGHCAA